ncbi:amidohydrolase family protein [Actinomarinicola tropica]|uniref:Amidohydrolase family protein n=1 Tax=Actinomarinicola tropica TaxID=2789776 RepID=A0A5Q2RJK9_9ACTN|nr:amidohydrolase family protein [Actinomarinicola tropica]QGG94576.1 amidohydrolase family protein [Actinomarinicola tropica]
MTDAATRTYAGEQRMLDADSHVMELADFLDPHIDDAFRPLLRRKGMDALAPVLEKARSQAEARKVDAERAAEAEARLLQDKGWSAVGAFDQQERIRALDLFGFHGQLVFATFATSMFSGRDLDRLYAGAAAQNRAMVDFCSVDDRLLPVGYVPLNDPARALATLEEALELGCDAVMVPSTAAGELAPTHPDLFPVWDTLAQADVPFVLHVGGGGRLLDRAFHNNAMPVSDHLGGGENIRSKDFLAIHHSPELFLGALIYDGIFDRFPTLRGGCIEQGASWVPSWMRHLDYGLRAFRRTEEPLQRLEHQPSDYVRRNLTFTPFPGEPLGWMIEQAGDVFLFSTDYPHPEGGRDPIAKFEEQIGEVSTAQRDAFYYGNMARLLGRRFAAAAA